MNADPVPVLVSGDQIPASAVVTRYQNSSGADGTTTRYQNSSGADGTTTRYQNSNGADGTTPVLDAWQAALAAEQQAAFGYALLGPRLPTSQQQAARSAQAAHETTRDATAVAIAHNGTTPHPPAGDYPALYPRAGAPRTLAAELEDDCAAAWRFLYAQAAAAGNAPADTAVRTQAQAALIASAVRATQWRKLSGAVRAVQAFPGE